MLTITILFNRIVVSHRKINGAIYNSIGGRFKPSTTVIQASATAPATFFGPCGPKYVPYGQLSLAAAARPGGFRF
jgi:hypothetical protein